MLYSNYQSNPKLDPSLGYFRGRVNDLCNGLVQCSYARLERQARRWLSGLGGLDCTREFR